MKPAVRKVMLLIDADNVSAGVIEQAMARVLAEHGAIHVRRAYCTAETAVAQHKLFKALSIRPIVNLSSGKNANDIALAVDALDLAIGERPDVAVIVSSDSDFAPLVLRLREKGCRVEGIGQLGKTGDEVRRVYDDYTELSHKAPGRRASAAAPASVPASAAPEPAAPAPSRRRRAPRKTSAEAPPLQPPAEPAPVVEQAAAKSGARRRRSRR